VTVDAAADGSFKAQLSTTSTGVSLVQITKPNQAGVSMNHFSQFNVGQQGLVLNNSVTGSQTQMGGLVEGNPNLTHGAAGVIINQVNSQSPSYLKGWLEVAGQNAHVIIANPAGIVADGGSLINAQQITLSTGTPILTGTGALDYHRVRGGNLVIENLGLHTDTINATELFARAIQVNAEIQAGADLKLVAGINDIKADGSSIINQQKPADARTRPSVAIDSAALGGMYAGKIKLVVTEKGVGVSHAGKMSAKAGELEITAAGTIVNRGQITAAEKIKITSQSGNIINSGRVQSTKAGVQVEAKNILRQNGTVIARKDLEMKAKKVETTARSRQTSTAANIIVEASDQLLVAGQWKAGTVPAAWRLDNRIQLQGREFDFATSEVNADRLKVNATQLHIHDVTLGTDLEVTSQNTKIERSDLYRSTIHINSEDILVNQSQINADDLSLNAQRSLYINTSQIGSWEQITLSAGQLTLMNSQIGSSTTEQLKIQAEFLEMRGNGIQADTIELQTQQGFIENNFW
jgi:filamentous hemagglutinin